MFSKFFLVLFLGLILSSTVARGLPSPQSRDEKTSSESPSSNDKKGSNNSPSGSKNDSKDNNKGNNKDSNNNGGNNDPQKSFTLDPRVISKGFEDDGQKNGNPGQVASLTSGNNFINFCLTIKTGSCNTAPMGVLPSADNMPSSKFTSPRNLDVIKANANFTIKMKIQNLEAGNFVNAESNYYSAPQQLNKEGNIIGHTHFVVQKVESFTSTKVLDPKVFTFFKGVNTPADARGEVSVSVDQGLPEGDYRLASINTSENHTPALGPVAQHGFFDDVIYFSATKDGKGKGDNKDAKGNGNDTKDNAKNAKDNSKDS
ncbi:hypothetical protein BJY52DRAFT_1191013 [Lactarius psammicola]|nr:hypothetical protein BJY52DRAFT_1191013 [Lactarius psammicola]